MGGADTDVRSTGETISLAILGIRAAKKICGREETNEVAVGSEVSWGVIEAWVVWVIGAEAQPRPSLRFSRDVRESSDVGSGPWPEDQSESNLERSRAVMPIQDSGTRPRNLGVRSEGFPRQNRRGTRSRHGRMFRPDQRDETAPDEGPPHSLHIGDYER